MVCMTILLVEDNLKIVDADRFIYHFIIVSLIVVLSNIIM